MTEGIPPINDKPIPVPEPENGGENTVFENQSENLEKKKKIQDFYALIDEKLEDGLLGKENTISIVVSGIPLGAIVFGFEYGIGRIGIFIDNTKYARKTFEIDNEGNVTEDTSGVLPEFDLTDHEPDFSHVSDEDIVVKVFDQILATKPELFVEKEPATYEMAQSAMKSLLEAGIKELPTINEPKTLNPEAKPAFLIIRQWRKELGLFGFRDINDIDKAKNIVKSFMLPIEAGFTDLETLKKVRLDLGGELDYEIRRRDEMMKSGGDGELAQKIEIANQVIEILETAFKSLQTRIEQADPKEQLKGKVEAAIDEIIKKSTGGERKDVIDAVRQIANMLSKTNIEFNKYFKTPEGKKHYAMLIQMDPIAENIYKATVAAKKDETQIRQLEASLQEMLKFRDLMQNK